LIEFGITESTISRSVKAKYLRVFSLAILDFKTSGITSKITLNNKKETVGTHNDLGITVLYGAEINE
jgi:DNA-directed RNA polymerase specialized sigma54-like protein